jgi:hypothetical protein
MQPYSGVGFGLLRIHGRAMRVRHRRVIAAFANMTLVVAAVPLGLAPVIVTVGAGVT